MSDKNTDTGLTNTQICWVLNDIAIAAKALERLSIMAETDPGDGRDVSAMHSSMQFMAQRIGLLADRAADGLEGTIGGVFGIDVEDWMMPPAYHIEADKPEGKHSPEM